MAWTDPPERFTGDLITAADYEADIRQNLIFLKGTGAPVAWDMQTMTAGTGGAVAKSIVRVTGSPAATPVTIPVAISNDDGSMLWVFDQTTGAGAGGGTITITPDSGRTIDGAATATINSKGGALLLVADGTNWTTLSAWGGPG